MKRPGSDFSESDDVQNTFSKWKRRWQGEERSASEESLGNGNENPSLSEDLRNDGVNFPAPPSSSTDTEAQNVTSGDVAEQVEAELCVGGSGSWSDAALSVGSSQKDDTVALICYGMMPKIKCKRLQASSAQIASSGAQSKNGAANVQLELLTKRDRLVIGTSLYPNLAYVNRKATNVLLEVFKLGAQVRLFARQDELQEIPDGSLIEKRLQFFYVDANIVGPPGAADQVGSLLSRNSVFLQAPIYSAGNMEYSNPQVMDVGISETDIWFQQIALDSKRADAIGGISNWQLILNSSSQQHKFDAAAVSLDAATFVSEALQHQREALDFMHRRELGGSLLGNDLRFWQLERNDDGVPVYRHTVTCDERYQSQPEPQGGILADEMGLGKTLTSIMLVACSLDRGRHFVRSDPATLTRNTQALPRSKATLVVVPSTLLMESWMGELERHTSPGSLSITKYHGPERVCHYSQLLEFDIILTTYGTITTEYRNNRRRVLYHMTFFRIILDEAHTIQGRLTKRFAAVMTLSAGHHWCLTGTPISNSIDDLSALLDFCRVPLLGNIQCFRKHVAAVARKSIEKASVALKETLKPVCLRRTMNLLSISQPTTVVKEVVFTAAERLQYDHIMREQRRAIDDPNPGRPNTNSRHNVLRAILELRIFCNQGTFTPKRGHSTAQSIPDPDELLTFLEAKEDAVCCLCHATIAIINQLEDADSGILAQCSHVLCRTCYDDIDGAKSESAGFTCPVCKIPTAIRYVEAGDPLVNTTQDFTRHSSKLNALTDELILSQSSDAPEKSIVFSVWRRTLSIAARLCTQRSIRFVQIDGATPYSERSERLRRFIRDPEISALLMTIGTLALGLNITAATRIHILEPQWNPAVEDQAIGRTVRLGQARIVTVTRYIVKDSIEEQIQQDQRRKRNGLPAGGSDEAFSSAVNAIRVAAPA